MRTHTRLAAYGLALAVTFGAGAGLGAVVGPAADDDPPADTPGHRPLPGPHGATDGTGHGDG